jgi:hypothetical protein
MTFRLPLALILILMLDAPAAGACSCMTPLTAADQFRSAHLVFLGKVESIEDRRTRIRRFLLMVRELIGQAPEMDWPAYERSNGFEVTFRAVTTWKGPPKREVRVLTGRGGGDCGYPFKVGETYLVYAYVNEVAYTGICTRTHEAAIAGDDLADLAKLPAVTSRP